MRNSLTLLSGACWSCLGTFKTQFQYLITNDHTPLKMRKKRWLCVIESRTSFSYDKNINFICLKKTELKHPRCFERKWEKKRRRNFFLIKSNIFLYLYFINQIFIFLIFFIALNLIRKIIDWTKLSGLLHDSEIACYALKIYYSKLYETIIFRVKKLRLTMKNIFLMHCKNHLLWILHIIQSFFSSVG